MSTMEENFVKGLMTSIKCSGCGRKYRRGNVRIIYHQDDLWFFNVFCEKCHSQSLVAALIKGHEADIVTDISPEEMVKFQDAPPVGMDDVLDMHNLLTDFRGDFSGLFRKDARL